MKVVQTGSLISCLIAISLATSSCGSASRGSPQTKMASDPSSSIASLSCVMMYYDSGIQKDPLYNESFEMQLPLASGETKFFGVTPDTNDYYAAVSPNIGEPTQVGLTLGRASTEVSATTILETKTTNQQMVELKLNAARSFVLSCGKIGLR